MKQLLFFLLASSLLVAQGHQVTLTSASPDCKNDTSCNGTTGNLTNCLCDLHVYRASCPPTSTCGGYTQLPASGVTAAVSASGTAWTYLDSDTALTSNSRWNYYETVSRQQSPTTVSTTTPVLNITIPATAATTHQATLNWTNTGCVTGNDCWIQVWRADCGLQNNACPSFITNPSSFVQPVGLQFPVWNTTPTGTTWQVIDSDPALLDNESYVYVATVCWQPACTAYSQPSAPWSGTTAGPGSPLAPSVGSGNTVTRNRESNPFKRLWAKLKGDK